MMSPKDLQPLLVSNIENDLRAVFLQTAGHFESSPGTATSPEVDAKHPHCAHWATEALEAHLHPLQAGGKRVRPILCLMMAGALAGDAGVSLAREAACALELVHTYSLVHDDLPCMDNDDLRRGLPTTHKVYGDAKALLVGDGLLTSAFAILPRTGSILRRQHPALWPSNEQLAKRLLVSQLRAHLASILATQAGPSGMVLGQWLDISFTGATALPAWDDLVTLHKFKTGGLLAAACEMGVLCGQAALGLAGTEQMALKLQSPDLSDSLPGSLQDPRACPVRQHARTAGHMLGLAFQIIDDILDVTQSSSVLGKTPGKDAAQNKLTSVSVLGLEGAHAAAMQAQEQAIAALDRVFALGSTESDSLPWQEALLTFAKSLFQRTH